MHVYLSKYFLAENNILSSFKLARPWCISWDGRSSHLMGQADVSCCDVQLIYTMINTITCSRLL